MVDNEEAIAELLYTMWQSTTDTTWGQLPADQLAKWQRLTRYVLSREILLVAKLAKQSQYEEFSKRIISRIDRWRAEKDTAK